MTSRFVPSSTVAVGVGSAANASSASDSSCGLRTANEARAAKWVRRRQRLPASVWRSMSCASSVSRSRCALRASAPEERADSGIMKPAAGAGGTDQTRGCGGRYSRTTQCPFAPPKPKELMPMTTGRSGKGSQAVCTCSGQLSKSISGFGARKFREVGANVRCRSIRMTLSRAQWNAAASMWPTLLLTLDIRSGASRSTPPNASVMALPSMRSPTTVPVAWAST